jgi:hypothetical protein
VVGERDEEGVVERPRRAEDPLLDLAAPSVEERAHQVRVASVERRGPGVLRETRVPADAEAQSPTVHSERASTGTGHEPGASLGRIEVSLVVFGGVPAGAVKHDRRDVQRAGLRIAGRCADDRRGTGLLAGDRERVEARVGRTGGVFRGFAGDPGQLVPGEKQLRKHHHIGALVGGAPYQIRRTGDVRPHVERHTRRLPDRYSQRRFRRRTEISHATTVPATIMRSLDKILILGILLGMISSSVTP